MFGPSNINLTVGATKVNYYHGYYRWYLPKPFKTHIICFELKKQKSIDLHYGFGQY